MKRFLQFFTREKEELFFGTLLFIGMIGTALYSMEVLHHPIHFELDHVRMEDDFRSLSESCDEANRKRSADLADERFQDEMRQKRAEHERFMQELERRRRHFEESEKYIEEYNRKMKESR